MRSILFFLLIAFFVPIFPTSVQACMGFGCNADVMILGEVISTEAEMEKVKPFHIFPLSIEVKNEVLEVENKDNELQINKKYALSLVEEADFYSLNWQAIEVEGTSFENSKVLHLKTADDASLQMLINNNGNSPSTTFYGVGDKLFVRIGDQDSPFFRDFQVFPEALTGMRIVLIALGGFFGGCLITYSLARRKKSGV